MKLATLRDGSRDGRLVVVRRDGEVGALSPEAWPTLQRALDDWTLAEPALRALAGALDAGSHDRPLVIDERSESWGRGPTGSAGGEGVRPLVIDERSESRGRGPTGSAGGEGVRPLVIDPQRLAAPLPRAYEWVDGSAFLNHVILVRRARGAEPPASLTTDPLIYQGGSGDMLGPRDPIELRDPAWGLDYESEVAVILGDTPLGITAGDAARAIRLVMLANDCTLRNLVPDELAKGFGFFCSKPATAFSPFAVTPDELEAGNAWRDGRFHGRVRSTYNGRVIGDCEAGPEMHFSFTDLIRHIGKTRRFTAGTILGSGTVSNADRSRGVSCLAERRMIEIIETGKPVTPFMAVGDRIVIEADVSGANPFGAIDQRVVAAGAQV